VHTVYPTTAGQRTLRGCVGRAAGGRLGWWCAALPDHVQAVATPLMAPGTLNLSLWPDPSSPTPVLHKRRQLRALGCQAPPPVVSSTHHACSMLSCWAPLPAGLQSGGQGGNKEG
jgi:hypothetical protein